MSYHYWIINFLPVDIDAQHVIKSFYIQHRQFTILSSKEVSLLNAKGSYMNVDGVVYETCQMINTLSPFIYRGATINICDGIKEIYLRFWEQRATLGVR